MENGKKEIEHFVLRKIQTVESHFSLDQLCQREVFQCAIQFRVNLPNMGDFLWITEEKEGGREDDDETARLMQRGHEM